MQRSLSRTAMWLFGLAVLAAPSLDASMILKMDLANLCDRADKIFRGSVVSVTEGTVRVGGGTLPTVTYRLKVTEKLKGSYIDKGDESFAEITMVAPVKRVPVDNLQAFSKLPDLPQLIEGQEYLLITTAPSSAGLSTTVGVGQGAFKIFLTDKTEMAVNELGNLGLYDGPVAYSRLADDIRARLGH